jgi:hypothetical protein
MSKKELLEGMKQICDFIGRSEPTVIKMIRAESLETRRIIWKRQGIWIANRNRLYEWWVKGVDEW